MANLTSESVHFTELGQRLAGLRDACGYSVEEFAEKLELEIDVYRAYEETGYDIPISLLMHIANICNVDMGVLLTGMSTHLDTYQVVRAGQGRVVNRLPGYHFEDLAYSYSNKIMQPLRVTLDPHKEPAALVVHAGQEFNYVTKGSIILVLNDQKVTLNEGDCIYFDPGIPHAQHCASEEPATFITMITE